ncbi:RdRP-domain-containing protein [Durotheca rogersii]|uniref:RdRP-domain-containing protein n=1 Tax=Durotheca rogersii TaxID=419775 RepID=UPI002220A3C5|nr:RdRP-domain-containing protein [Durotheca rogersii]KAI5860371.1 RdRP-domain-containing protein [Durotheca rogersii]
MDSMEVFIRGLPSDLSDKSLEMQLTGFMKKLRITNWTCQKSRKKSIGSITFLHRVDGEKFLRTHGEKEIPGISKNGKPRTRAQLQLFNSNIYCKASDRIPDQFLLRTLLKTAEDEQLKGKEEEEEEERARAHSKSVSFELRELSCGHYEYPDGRLTYAADIAWHSQGTAKFARDMLIITFKTRSGLARVEILYRTIEWVLASGYPSSLLLTLWEAPRFFEAADQIAELTSGMNGLGISKKPAAGANQPSRVRVSKLPHDLANHAEIVGQSLVYCLQVSPADFRYKLEVVKAKECFTVINHDLPGFSPKMTLMHTGQKEFKRVVEQFATRNTVPFDILFQFQALVQNGYILPQVAATLLGRLSRASRASSAHQPPGRPESKFPFSAAAVKKLFGQTPFPGPETEASSFTPDGIWSYLEENEKKVRLGIEEELITERARQNLVMVYKVQVTPSRIMLAGPEPEAKNRILRKFPDHTGFFARLQFCEEDGQDLYFNARVSLDRIWARFKQILNDGIIIAGRKYGFLGFSHSSLRAHGVWFMSSFFDQDGDLHTYFSVIRDLGKFNSIFSPPRCAARIGQAFSETPFSVDLVELGVEIEFIPDVKSADGSRVFSDGVGTISRALMEAIRASLPLRKSKNHATCFQIRWAGAKGMLALDDTLRGMVMRIRKESMVKFDSDDTRYLEICDMGNKPIPLVLNRQMIKILEDMRVADDWFFQIQNQELKRLRMITADVHNTMVFLKRQKVADQINFSQFIKRLSRLGIDYKNDPFLCSVVETVVLREVRLLKHKARIPVQQGVTLFGVMDEFAYLKEDEVFVTFDEDKLLGVGYPYLHQKLVLVTRSPALHPGDIQVRRSVIPPPHHPLCALKNCIVFSQKGERDLPSQLSGGDLDGDIYNIIWDEQAVSSSKLEFEPADYPRVSPVTIDTEVTREHMTDFFVEFMATDQLGVIAIKHMVLADMRDSGTVDPECKLLAEMHSTGVDYSKSGIPIDANKLKSLTRTRYRPEFLSPAPPANIVNRSEVTFEVPRAPSPEDDEDDNTPRFRYYKSTKILGKLYRAIDEKKIWREDIRRKVPLSTKPVWDLLTRQILKKCRELGGVNWQPAVEEATHLRQAYDDAVWTLAMDFRESTNKALSELEVFTGCIFNKSGVQTRRQRDTSVRLKDEYDRVSKWIRDLIRKRGPRPDEEEEEEDDDDDDDDDDEVGGTALNDDVGNDPYDGSEASEASFVRSSRNITPLELSIACLYVGTKGPERFSGREETKIGSFKIVAAQCALTELEAALSLKREAEAAFFESATARFMAGPISSTSRAAPYYHR